MYAIRSYYEDAEGRAFGHHAQVAPQRELGAARDRIAFDRGDHRLRQAHPGRPHRAHRPFGVVGLPLALGHRAQVGTAAEMAVRAGEDRDVQCLVGVEALERGVQRALGVDVDRVASLGPVDGDDSYNFV